jgi:hypothetical protein
MTHSIIQNFLDQDHLDLFVKTLSYPAFPWETDSSNDPWYRFHMLYKDGETSEYWHIFEPLIQKLPNLKHLHRVKANLYWRCNENRISWWHQDMLHSHQGCVISLNTCNGGTALGPESDPVIVPSIANQCLLFDPGQMHSAVLSTDQRVRLNINCNWV